MVAAVRSGGSVCIRCQIMRFCEMFKEIALKVVLEVGFKLAIIAVGLIYCSTTYYQSRYLPVVEPNSSSLYCFDTHTGKTWLADVVQNKKERPE